MIILSYYRSQLHNLGKEKNFQIIYLYKDVKSRGSDTNPAECRAGKKVPPLVARAYLNERKVRWSLRKSW